MNFFAKKSLGQNFLASPQAVLDIARAAEIAAGETVVEIGPGKGVLTEALLEGGARVIAYEKDDRLIPVLEEKFSKESSGGVFSLVHADILSADLGGLPHIYKVVANIPYYITGEILRMFLEAEQKPSRMILMVQKEVADRILAKDGKESILSASVKLFGTPSLVRKVGRGSFRPSPAVDSAVIAISGIRAPFVDRAMEKRFFEIVKAGFAQKRKKLVKNLEVVASRDALAKAFAELSLDENVRAEDLSIDTWKKLTERL